MGWVIAITLAFMGLAFAIADKSGSGIDSAGLFHAVVIIGLVGCLVAACCTGCDASHRRMDRASLKVARVQLRTARANSGRPVAWGFYYSARTAANVSGLINPVSWLFGGIL